MVAISLLVLIGMLVLTVDLGSMVAKRRQLVAANDAAALAAAFSCGSGEGEDAADASADTYARENVPNAFRVGDPVYDPSCDAAAGTVEVHYSAPHNLYFAPILGFGSEADVTATAMASWGVSGAYAIFAGSTTCDKTIDWSGSTSTATGGVHSNNELYVGGTGNTIEGSSTYVNDLFANSGNTFTPPPIQSATLPYPVDFQISEYAPGGAKANLATSQGRYFNAGNTKIDKGWLESRGLYNDSTKTIATGLYYTTADIDLSISDLNGTITVVSSNGTISMNGSGQDVTAWDPEQLLAFSYRDGGCSNVGVKVDGSSSFWRGIVFAPRAMAEMSGSNNSTLEGSLIANTVRVNGSGVHVNAIECCGRPQVRLVQ